MSRLIDATPAPLRIVVVEDVDALREQVVHFLSRPEWRVRGASDGIELDERLREEPTDIVVLDVGLPGEDGNQIAMRLRRALPGIGLVMLTARVAPSDRAHGYGSGADVYLTKPVNPLELEAALFSLARRLAPSRLGVTLDVVRGHLRSIEGVAVHLTPTECALLQELALAPLQRLSHEALCTRLGDVLSLVMSKAGLAVHISRLRERCSLQPSLAGLIVAERGIGYRLGLHVALLR